MRGIYTFYISHCAAHYKTATMKCIEYFKEKLETVINDQINIFAIVLGVSCLMEVCWDKEVKMRRIHNNRRIDDEFPSNFSHSIKAFRKLLDFRFSRPNFQ